MRKGYLPSERSPILAMVLAAILGLPCIIGNTGIERQLVLPRSAEEQRLLQKSADKLNSFYNSLDD